MGGLELEPDLARRAADPDGGWRVGHAEAERAAAALGYVARLTQRLAHLLDVPLRYPLRFANSRSSVFSHPPPAGTIGCAPWIINIMMTYFSCQKARYVLQTSCTSRLPHSYPLLDSPDSSKSQSIVGMVLSIHSHFPPAGAKPWLAIFV